jgi:predicted RNase H-like HicB family nuclease
MQREYSYQVLLIPDLEVGGYTVEVPALPGCITEGDTVEEALENAKEAIQAWIESAIAHHEPIPEEHPLIVTNVSVNNGR